MNDNYGELQIAARRISGNSELAEELLHYTIDEFLRKPNVEDIVTSGGGRFYCVRIMMTQWNSSTGPFYLTYRRQDVPLESIAEGEVDADLMNWMEENIFGYVSYKNLYRIENEEENQKKAKEVADKANQLLGTLPWYDKMLFDTFVNENHTVSSLARATGIPRTSISLTINRVRKYLKKNL